MTPAGEARGARQAVGDLDGRRLSGALARLQRALTIRPDDLIGNWQRALKFDSQTRLGNVARHGRRRVAAAAADRQRVLQSPATNEIVLPAAILQPPLFDLDADDAVNYGAAGALIGHEIGHAFDDRGRRFDGAGAVRDWWTDARRRALPGARRAARRADERVRTAAGPARQRRRWRAAESMGDLGGLAIAFRAYKLSLKGKRVARHRRPDRRAALLHGLGADLAVEGARRIPAVDAADQRLPARRPSAPTRPRATSMAFSRHSVSNQGTVCTARPSNA